MEAPWPAEFMQSLCSPALKETLKPGDGILASERHANVLAPGDKEYQYWEESSGTGGKINLAPQSLSKQREQRLQVCRIPGRRAWCLGT